VLAGAGAVAAPVEPPSEAPQPASSVAAASAASNGVRCFDAVGMDEVYPLRALPVHDGDAESSAGRVA
jgi:hypothetical protein